MIIKQYDLEFNKDTRLNKLVIVNDFECSDEMKTVSSPQMVYKLACDTLKLDRKAEEHVYMIAVNSKFQVIGVFLVTKGTVNFSVLNPREVFIRALLIGAVNIILLHNHPSGDVSPSQEDNLLTARMSEAGKLLGVFLGDHIIIGKHYYSYDENGKL